LQSAAVVLTNGPGADDAAWLSLISINQSRLCETTSAEFELSDFIQVQDYRTVHSHGDEGEHSHPWLVPQCWLNPRLATAQSVAILNRLVAMFPEQETAFTANHRSLREELEAVEELAGDVATLIKSRNLTVIASDPRLLFFTRSLSLEDNYFLWFEPPETSAAIAELEKRKPESGGHLLLLCPPAASSLVEGLSQSLGIETATVSLIQSSAEGKDADTFVKELRRNYQTLQDIVQGMTH
jgi:zinc transport system substrate-binding protein